MSADYSISLLYSLLTGFVQIPTVIDATRRSDDACVSIKSIKNDTKELHIAQYLTEQHSVRNHCVPVLEIMRDPSEPSLALIFMPYLRPFNDPEFGTIAEVMEFIRQSLEVFLYVLIPVIPLRIHLNFRV